MPGVGSAGASCSIPGKEGGQPGGGRRLERVKQCLGALFSFSTIPKQQISPGLKQAISVPAQQ